MPVWKITKIKTLLSALFDFLFFLHSAEIHSLILNFYSWNQPIRMREMSFTKLKAISHSLCRALAIPLCCTFTKIRLLYIAKIRSRFPFREKYFIFLKWFLNSLGGIWQGELTEEGGEREQSTGKNSACTIITDQTFDEKMLLNSSWCLTVSSITFILYNNPNLNNCFHFCK